MSAHVNGNTARIDICLHVASTRATEPVHEESRRERAAQRGRGVVKATHALVSSGVKHRTRRKERAKKHLLSGGRAVAGAKQGTLAFAAEGAKHSQRRAQTNLSKGIARAATEAKTVSRGSMLPARGLAALSSGYRQFAHAPEHISIAISSRRSVALRMTRGTVAQSMHKRSFFLK